MLRPKKNQSNGTVIIEPVSVPDLHFPDEVYDKLPPLLKEVCNCFDTKLEKDIALLGSLGVISGCLPNIFGKYDRKKHGANLFFFIVAPASAGKGSLTWTKLLGQKIHELKRNEYRAALQEYNEAEKSKSNKNNGQVNPPKQKLLFIPANTSASAFSQSLSDNGGSGILFCSEADTLSNSLSQDWGNYSDIIRKAFHHESISSLRASNVLHHEIDKPAVSIILSGTPNQVTRLIPNTENGLFSRFGYYRFDIEPRMKNVWKEDENDLEEYLVSLGSEILKRYQHLKENDERIEFRYTKEQQQDFLNRYKSGHTEYLLELGLSSISAIRRLGLIEFRVAMILSSLRLNSNEPCPEIITCTDEDYQTASQIAYVLKNHTKKIFEELPNESKDIKTTPERTKLYNALPDEFKRAEAILIADQMGVSHPTVDRLLKEKIFEKLKYGLYRKLK